MSQSGLGRFVTSTDGTKRGCMGSRGGAIQRLHAFTATLALRFYAGGGANEMMIGTRNGTPYCRSPAAFNYPADNKIYAFKCRRFPLPTWLGLQ